MNNIKVSENFTMREYESPDTGEVKIHEDLARLNQAVREELDTPLIINSAYRTKEHNEEVGSKETSQHRNGNAADISTRKGRYTERQLPFHGLTSKELSEIYKDKANELNIGEKNLGLGFANTFLHVDVRGVEGYPSPARWNY